MATSVDMPGPPAAPAARGLSRLTDSQLALVISGVLLLVGAWPLALTDIPPYQDLPNHLATVVVIENPARFGPEDRRHGAVRVIQ